MSMNNPIPRSGMVRFHEASPQRSPRDSDAIARSWIKTKKTATQVAQLQENVSSVQRQLDKLRRRKAMPAAGGDRWQTPKELDPDVAVPQGTWVYISPNNPLATTGLLDPPPSGGTITMAIPGIWEAIQDVPATDGFSYNVPKYPYPEGTPTGTPLEGDLDNSDVYWILIAPAQVCT